MNDAQPGARADARHSISSSSGNPSRASQLMRYPEPKESRACQLDRPHFHAIYGEYEITVNIADGIATGQFPRRALSHVLEWYQQHREELMLDWERARRHEPLSPISPLE